jgi:hypothetical protein
MRNRIERFLLSPAHPILLSLYFVFRLYVFNIAGVPREDLLRPLLISILSALVLLGIFYLLVRDWQRAALLDSLVLAWFFLYGLFRTAVLASNLRLHFVSLAALWTLIAALFIVWIPSRPKRPVDLNVVTSLNLMAVILLLFPVMQWFRYTAVRVLPFTPDADVAVRIHASDSSPDIYYIILDTYGRADALEELYGYDNSAFLNGLRGLGFYVADCSQSNYSETGLSLTSALNMNYLQNIDDVFAPDKNELIQLFKLLDQNAVRRMLEDAGYTTVVYASGFYWAEWRDADVFLAPPRGPVTDFETVILLSSFARVLDDSGTVNLDDVSGENYRRRTRLVLESFATLDEIPGPKFVFMHIIAPHPPSVFDEFGNPTPPDKTDPDTGYVNMLKFINAALLPELENLINDSKNPPVILVQGDHGPYPSRRHVHMKILNAYYLPRGADRLYPSISPVNSFRVIFNEYFGTEYPLLEDVSYYPRPGRHYDFTVEPNTCGK